MDKRPSAYLYFGLCNLCQRSRFETLRDNARVPRPAAHTESRKLSKRYLRHKLYIYHVEGHHGINNIWKEQKGCIITETSSYQQIGYAGRKVLHSVCCIRDAAKWPLDASHNFSNILSTSVPYHLNLSLIYPTNLPRLSPYTYWFFQSQLPWLFFSSVPYKLSHITHTGCMRGM